MTEIDNLKDIINDLTLSLEMWIDGYPFDEDHKAKQRILINRACLAIGKPRSIKELIEISGIKLEPETIERLKKEKNWEPDEFKLDELCHKCFYTFCSIKNDCERYKRVNKI